MKVRSQAARSAAIRVLLEDLLRYKREFPAKRHAALDELQALSQALDLY